MIRWLAGLFAIIGLTLVSAPSSYAESSLGVQPLQYTETLQKGEHKKAFIDVSNPSLLPVTAQFSVQGFKQVDNKGTLSFYDDQKLNEGILLDYKEQEIPPGKTLRLFFIVDGSKLPTGDVFAAIFARTKPDEKASAPSVRIGTLLILENETPGARQAEVTSFATPFFQAGRSITGEIKIKNTAPVGTSSGFSPKVEVRLWPFGPNKTLTAPLVFAGNTRTIKLSEPSNQFGIYRITASHGASHKDQWIVLVTGIWRWIILGIIAGIILLAFWYKFVYKKSLSKRH